MTPKTDRINLFIENLTTAEHAQRLETALSHADGVLKVRVVFPDAVARIDYLPVKISPPDLEAVIESAGHTVKQHRAHADLKIPAMTDARAARSIERNLLDVQGVIHTAPDLASAQIAVAFDPDKTSRDRLAETLAEAGYPASVIRAREVHPSSAISHEPARAPRTLLVGWAITVPLVLLTGLDDIGLLRLPGWDWLETLFSLLVLALAGKPTYRSAMRIPPALDTLVALSATAAFVTGPLHIAGLLPHNLATVAALVAAIHATARELENRTQAGSTRAVRRLRALQPAYAHVERHGELTDISLDELRPGNFITVDPGERIPADGQIMSGQSTVDESAITGATLPLDKGPGDNVLAGGLNTDRPLRIRATQTGPDTSLAQRIQLVERAQAVTPPVQAAMDRSVAILTPVALALALVTYMLWVAAPDAMLRLHDRIAAILPWPAPDPSPPYSALAVLVIMCPAALGLVLRLPVVIAIGAAAQQGIVIRNPSALQTFRTIRALCIGKSGVLTQGRPVVAGVSSEPSSGPAILGLAASAERPSNHPVARAIVEAAKDEGVPLHDTTSFRTIPGKGILAKVNDQEVMVGKDRFLRDEGVNTSAFSFALRDYEDQGYATVMVAVDGNAVAAVALEDPLRPETKTAVETLSRRGLHVVLLTGGNEPTARHVAGELGIERVVANVPLDEKCTAVQKLRAEFGKVAVVGHGVEDAEVLAQADLGVAIGMGGHVAIDPADVVLAGEDLSSLVSTADILRRAFGTIRRNFVWAGIYGVLALPFAALGVLTPAFALATIALEAICITLDSLFLRRFHR